jgi:hypothetical protein
MAHNFAHSTAKMTAAPGTGTKMYRIFFPWWQHTPFKMDCCSMIIHVFSMWIDFKTPPAVFGQTVGLFAFIGLTVASLRFSAGFKTTFHAACIATISLSTKATPAYIKIGVAPATRYLDQFQHPALKVAGV